jgi:glycosyltransferase involved in cell wall biosynthesis
MNNIILFTLTIIFVVLYIINRNYIYNYHIKSKLISIGVPCILKHVKHLPTLIKSINNQTLLPYEIIISLSSTDKITGEYISKKLNKISKVNVKVIDTIEEKYAGDNRNICVENCNTELISFIDADDELCLTRTEVLEKVYKEYDYDVLYHLHTNKKVCNNFDGKVINNNVLREKIKTDYNKFLHITKASIEVNKIHHGHYTIKTDIMKKIPAKSYRRAQDVEHLNRLHLNPDINMVALPTYRGTIYNKQFSSIGIDHPLF